MELTINLTDQDKNEISQAVVAALRPLVTAKENPETIFTVESLAEYLSVSKKWVYERVQFKEIPFAKTGGFLRFKKSDVDRWLDSHKTPAVHPLTTGKLKGGRG